MVEGVGGLKKNTPTSTVGRGKAVRLMTEPEAPMFADEAVTLCLGDSLHLYESWETPNVIVSDGAYGILGFEGCPSLPR